MRRFNELSDRYGMDTVLTATGQLMDYTERVLRQRIAAIPDGEYRAEGFLDDDGRNRDVRLPIKVCVRVKGDGIEIDLTGSADRAVTNRGGAPRHRRLERSRTGPRKVTRAAGSAASLNRPRRYLAGNADRWVVLGETPDSCPRAGGAPREAGLLPDGARPGQREQAET